MDERTIELGKLIIYPQDRQKTIETKYGNFVIRLLNPLEKRRLISRIAAEAGAPVTNLADVDYVYLVASVTVPAIIIAAPDWYRGIESFADESTIFEIYRAYQELESDYGRRLRSGAFERGGKGAPVGGVDSK